MISNHLGLVCDLGELSAVLDASQDTDAFVIRTLDLVARHLQAPVCTLYLYNENEDRLVLHHTLGLNPGANGTVSLRPGEGIVGTAFESGKPVNVPCATRHAAFKSVPGIDEEHFPAFLAVPVIRGNLRLGVLVVQRGEHAPFDEKDQMALRATALQLAGAIENVQALTGFGGTRREKSDRVLPVLIKGKGGGQGHVCAPAIVANRKSLYCPLDENCRPKRFTEEEFHRAIEATSQQLRTLEANLEQALPEAASLIFSAQQLMLRDRNFMQQIEDRIREGENPPEAVQAVARLYGDRFRASTHEYIREKAHDVEDMTNRLIFNIIDDNPDHPFLCEGRILIADDLYPSDVLRLASEKVAGLILVHGGVTSHVVILAHSLGIPLVIADTPDLLHVAEDTEILLDAEAGNVYVNPNAEIRTHYRELRTGHAEAKRAADAMQPQTHTVDGTRVRLLANINLLSELRLARELKAEGVGLYRSEFPFLVRNSYPDEEEQRVVYRKLFDFAPEGPISLRTLDVGGDKALAYHESHEEENPQLGLRSIRFCLANPDIFLTQLRAILRAAHDREALRLLFPMITSVEEFLHASRMVQRAIDSLCTDGLEHNNNPRLGMMIEVPAAVEILPDLAGYADFFTVGTNDFVQYMIAVDRTNEKIAHLYDPLHPAVIRAVHRIARTLLDHDKPVTICGEMAHVPVCVPLLLGAGLRNLSVDPRYLPEVQALVSRIDLHKAEALTERVLRMGSAAAIRERMNAFLQELPSS